MPLRYVSPHQHASSGCRLPGSSAASSAGHPLLTLLTALPGISRARTYVRLWLSNTDQLRSPSLSISHRFSH